MLCSENASADPKGLGVSGTARKGGVAKLGVDTDESSTAGLLFLLLRECPDSKEYCFPTNFYNDLQ